MNPQPVSFALALLVTTFVTACGGDGGDTAGSGVNDTPARGALVAARTTTTHAPGDVEVRLQASGAPSLGKAGACGVSVSHIDYATRDPQGRPATASAGVMVPTGNGANCTGARPVLLYAHGTTTLKSYDMADPEKTHEALLVEATCAAHGYIVVAPNYLGYDTSSMTYHPYLNAEVQAADMIDDLRAGLAHAASAGGPYPSKMLLLAGYSQGGHVAMATHKVLERDHAAEFTVTAAAPMSEPYDLVQFGDTVTSPSGPINVGATLFMPYLLTSYQNSYGSIYGSPAEVYQAPFDRTAPTLFPTDVQVETLIANAELPNDPTFRLLFGTGGLLTDRFRTGYGTSNFRKALQLNTLLGWSPKAPVALCGGADDPTVFFANTVSMKNDFSIRGIIVPAWNLEDRASLPVGTSYDEIYDGFQLAKLGAGARIQIGYHGVLVPPFCYAMARGLFAQYGGTGN
jgi:pimeloyl-ACP methyl ester carboxylesterase